MSDTERAARISASLDVAVAALLSEQSPEGCWEGDLDNKVSVDAHHLLAHRFLGLGQAAQGEAVLAWIRGEQTATGGWPNFAGGPDDVSTTVMAYLALRMEGEPPGLPRMRAAAERIHQLGGPAACRTSTRLWLALFGLGPWSEVKALPPEIVLLPSRGPLCLDDFADWARYLVVPLSVITTLRPVRPTDIDFSEICGPHPPVQHGPRATAARLRASAPPSPLRARALARAGAWLRERQQSDGGWNGTHSATVYAMIALHLLGGPGEEAVRRAAEGVTGFVRPRGEGLSRVQFSRGPVWDTALSLMALRAAGVEHDHPALRKARGWLLGLQTRDRGDWGAHRPGLPPGGWSFQSANRISPDTDDTAIVLCAFQDGPAGNDPLLRAAVERGRRWLAGMEWRDGGWAAFDADARVRRVLRLPLHDGRAVTDPPTADVTAHVVEALAQAGPEHAPAVRRGVRWLLRRQEPDGSWFGQWGCNYLYGTTAALCALATAGTDRGHAAVRNAVNWLYSRQNDDGGWGEDQRSYRYGEWSGRGETTASQTAWVLHALIATGERGRRLAAGVDWLLNHQEPSGLWRETPYTGTGFPWDAPIRYGSYPRVFPLLALDAYRRTLADPEVAAAHR
ncbi:squalene--hopene cyclase [Streptomyces sp. A3M-1-3]|uniref:squalene--hopene cyclase n=1 Tax=Streptomyces sp. A3M-1-3 TaxID=2962044 RepID=UPI0020B756FC|nr:squalene--hopene cyclase [Streptomyces sp. A3M-1-3]MCP3819383.1 squalene--hopene cyclase [Streptomyces sp. A3M-1-3]